MKRNVTFLVVRNGNYHVVIRVIGSEFEQDFWKEVISDLGPFVDDLMYTEQFEKVKEQVGDACLYLLSLEYIVTYDGYDFVEDSYKVIKLLG